MQTIEAVTILHAPIDKCFEWSLSIDLEVEAAKAFKLRPIGGVISGTISPGQRVQWRTKQFGLWITHTSEITGFERPVFFQDSMVQGIFRSFRHDHTFRALDSGKTEMRDRMSFSLPWYLGGSIAERWIVRRRLTHLLAVRNQLIREKAEAC